MDYFSGWCKSQLRLEGFTAVVTGANSGIGKETAKDLYLRGARVIMAYRDEAKAKTAKTELENQKSDKPKGTLVLEKLDLCSFKSIRDFAFRILESEDQINVLICNAGVMACPLGKTEDGFEVQIGSNHYGHALLAMLLLPRLRKSAPSRIVFVSSYLHRMVDIDFDDMNYEKTPYDPIQAYSKSKLANLLFARALATKLKEHDITDVTTYSLHPGVIATDVSRHFDETVWRGATFAFNYIMKYFVKSPRCGAQTTIYCAIDETCANQSGLYYADCAPSQPLTKQSRDDEAADRLWNVTLDALHLDSFDPFSNADPQREMFKANTPIIT